MPPRLLQSAVIMCCAIGVSALALVAEPRADELQDPAQPVSEPDTAELVRVGADRILTMQEGDNTAEWPYEGVYRVREDPNVRGPVIPIGYRVGGTSICAIALMQTPDFAESDAMQAAVDRAAEFVVGAIDHPLMQFDAIASTYDVRGWGYTYGVLFLLEYRSRAHGDGTSTESIDAAIRFCLDGIEATEIPESGGWNYARRGGFDRPGPMSPFMTAPTLQALFAADDAGFDVDADVITRGLDALERARQPTGAFVYAGQARPGAQNGPPVPGAVARMAAAETTLFLAGRSTVANVRSAIDAFIVHWDWLDKRRAQNGTHIPPYQIAPYYFYYGHYYAAQAVEMLPEPDRAEYHRRIRELLLRNRLDDGSWNDRVFPRSANYGTAMSIMTLMMPEIERPVGWVEE